MMASAIGGEFPIDISAFWADMPAQKRLSTLLPGRSVITSSGRGALQWILECLFKTDRHLSHFLLPSYLCESILRPFRNQGINVSFYPVGSNLEIDPEAVTQVLARSNAGGILFINYFGLPIKEELRAFFSTLKQRIWVVEDCVPGGLLEYSARTIGSTGHFAFTSLRKYLPVPEGAVVLDRSGCESTAPVGNQTTPDWLKLRLVGKFLKSVLLEQEFATEQKRLLESCYLELFSKSEALLDSTGGLASPCLPARMIDGYDLIDASARRKSNFEYCLEHLRQPIAEQTAIRPLFSTLPHRSSPLVFPLVCCDETQRDRLRSFLMEYRIFCPIHWPLPRDVTIADFPEAHSLSERILGLPIDQRYNTETMQYICGEVRAFRNRKRKVSKHG